MTLAETFLLLVFMLWYSIRPKLDTQPPTSIEVLQAENQRLKQENERLQSDINDLNRRLAFWQKRFDQPIPGSEEEVRTFLHEAGRGKPKCQDQNVLIEASVIDGTTTLKVLADSTGLRKTMHEQGIEFQPGTLITSPGAINAILRASRDFRKPPDNADCRFDYTFKYSTHDDYYEGRERFEKYFYTAGRTRAQY
jgi:hypothetical protein